jgi:hypothetical protein
MTVFLVTVFLVTVFLVIVSEGSRWPGFAVGCTPFRLV